MRGFFYLVVRLQNVLGTNWKEWKNVTDNSYFWKEEYF